MTDPSTWVDAHGDRLFARLEASGRGERDLR
jgi:hypothetical protein